MIEPGQLLDLRARIVDDMVGSYAPLRVLGERGRRFCEVDTAHHLEHLDMAVALGAPGLFFDYVRWVQRLLAARGIPAGALRLNLEATVRALEATSANPALAAAVAAAFGACDRVDESAPVERDLTLDAYLTAARAGHLQSVLRIATDWATTASPAEALQRLARCQHQIGEAWLKNEISVLIEHRATALTQAALGHLLTYTAAAPGPRPLGRALVACAEGDWHSVGPRIGADLLELSGFDVEFLGASTPTAELARAASTLRPDLVGIGAAPMTALPAARAAVAMIREICPEARIVVAGHAARLAGAALLGADTVLAQDFDGLLC